MKTNFGKFLTKLRVDHDERLSDMAGKLKVSPSFLSNVENGKKMFPGRFIAEICTLYNLDDKKKLELVDVVMNRSYDEYQDTKKAQVASQQ